MRSSPSQSRPHPVAYRAERMIRVPYIRNNKLMDNPALREWLDRIRAAHPGAFEIPADGFCEVEESQVILQLQYGLARPEVIEHLRVHYPELLIHQNAPCESLRHPQSEQESLSRLPSTPSTLHSSERLDDEGSV